MKQRILIADDDEFIRRLIELSLGKAYDVETAADGAEALEAVFATPPDLVLLDMSMPGMSGLDVAERLGSDPATSDIPCILITARVHPDDTGRAKSAGVVQVLTKPFSPAALREAVAAVLA